MGCGPLSGGGVVRDFCFVFFYFRANVSFLYLVLAEPFCSPRTGVLCCSAHDRTEGGDVLRTAEPCCSFVQFFIKSHNNQLG